MDKTHNFEELLSMLSEKVLRLGGLVEEAIGKAVRGLVDRDSELAREVPAGDHEIDSLELEIDDLCLEILARHQPMARDLRFSHETVLRSARSQAARRDPFSAVRRLSGVRFLPLSS